MEGLSYQQASKTYVVDAPKSHPTEAKVEWKKLATLSDVSTTDQCNKQNWINLPTSKDVNVSDEHVKCIDCTHLGPLDANMSDQLTQTSTESVKVPPHRDENVLDQNIETQVDMPTLRYLLTAADTKDFLNSDKNEINRIQKQNQCVGKTAMSTYSSGKISQKSDTDNIKWKNSTTIVSCSNNSGNLMNPKSRISDIDQSRYQSSTTVVSCYGGSADLTDPHSQTSDIDQSICQSSTTVVSCHGGNADLTDPQTQSSDIDQSKYESSTTVVSCPSNSPNVMDPQSQMRESMLQTSLTTNSSLSDCRDKIGQETQVTLSGSDSDARGGDMLSNDREGTRGRTYIVLGKNDTEYSCPNGEDKVGSKGDIGTKEIDCNNNETKEKEKADVDKGNNCQMKYAHDIQLDPGVVMKEGVNQKTILNHSETQVEGIMTVMCETLIDSYSENDINLKQNSESVNTTRSEMRTDNEHGHAFDQLSSRVDQNCKIFDEIIKTGLQTNKDDVRQESENKVVHHFKELCSSELNSEELQCVPLIGMTQTADSRTEGILHTQLALVEKGRKHGIGNVFDTDSFCNDTSNSNCSNTSGENNGTEQQGEIQKVSEQDSSGAKGFIKQTSDDTNISSLGSEAENGKRQSVKQDNILVAIKDTELLSSNAENVKQTNSDTTNIHSDINVKNVKHGTETRERIYLGNTGNGQDSGHGEEYRATCNGTHNEQFPKEDATNNENTEPLWVGTITDVRSLQSVEDTSVSTEAVEYVSISTEFESNSGAATIHISPVIESITATLNSDSCFPDPKASSCTQSELVAVPDKLPESNSESKTNRENENTEHGSAIVESCTSVGVSTKDQSGLLIPKLEQGDMSGKYRDGNLDIYIDPRQLISSVPKNRPSREAIKVPPNLQCRCGQKVGIHFHCEMCSYVTVHKSSFFRHEANCHSLHRPDISYITCHICQHRSVVLSDYNTHMKTHLGCKNKDVQAFANAEIDRCVALGFKDPRDRIPLSTLATFLRKPLQTDNLDSSLPICVKKEEQENKTESVSEDRDSSKCMTPNKDMVKNTRDKVSPCGISDRDVSSESIDKDVPWTRTCHLCGATLKTKLCLKAHIVSVHKQSGPGVFECKLCCFKTIIRAGLDIHCNTLKHSHRVRTLQLSNPDEYLVVPEFVAPSKRKRADEDNTFGCGLCSFWSNNPSDAEFHFTTQQHKDKVHEQNLKTSENCLTFDHLRGTRSTCKRRRIEQNASNQDADMRSSDSNMACEKKPDFSESSIAERSDENNDLLLPQKRLKESSPKKKVMPKCQVCNYTSRRGMYNLERHFLSSVHKNNIKQFEKSPKSLKNYTVSDGNSSLKDYPEGSINNGRPHGVTDNSESVDMNFQSKISQSCSNRKHLESNGQHPEHLETRLSASKKKGSLCRIGKNKTEKKSKKTVYLCKLCDKRTSNLYQLSSHSMSAAHKKKLRKLGKQNENPREYLVFPQTMNLITVKPNRPESVKAERPLQCKLCHFSTTIHQGVSHLKKHCLSTRHKNRVKELGKSNEDPRKYLVCPSLKSIMDQKQETYKCKLCHFTTKKSIRYLNQHCQTCDHKRNVRRLARSGGLLRSYLVYNSKSAKSGTRNDKVRRTLPIGSQLDMTTLRQRFKLQDCSVQLIRVEHDESLRDIGVKLDPKLQKRLGYHIKQGRSLTSKKLSQKQTLCSNKQPFVSPPQKEEMCDKNKAKAPLKMTQEIVEKDIKNSVKNDSSECHNKYLRPVAKKSITKAALAFVMKQRGKRRKCKGRGRKPKGKNVHLQVIENQSVSDTSFETHSQNLLGKDSKYGNGSTGHDKYNIFENLPMLNQHAANNENLGTKIKSDWSIPNAMHVKQNLDRIGAPNRALVTRGRDLSCVDSTGGESESLKGFAIGSLTQSDTESTNTSFSVDNFTHVRSFEFRPKIPQLPFPLQVEVNNPENRDASSESSTPSHMTEHLFTDQLGATFGRPAFNKCIATSTPRKPTLKQIILGCHQNLAREVPNGHVQSTSNQLEAADGQIGRSDCLASASSGAFSPKDNIPSMTLDNFLGVNSRGNVETMQMCDVTSSVQSDTERPKPSSSKGRMPDMYKFQSDPGNSRPSKENNEIKPCIDVNSTPTVTLNDFSDAELMGALFSRPTVYACICGMSFRSLPLYCVHRGCHNSTEPQRCAMCADTFDDWHNFHAHFVLHSNF